MVNIRNARLEDAGQISSVLAASWKTAYRAIIDDHYLDLLKNDHWVAFLNTGLSSGSIFSMVMEKDQDMIGAAILSKTEKDHEACLISLYLLPDRIGQGFGNDFYIGIENELIKRGFANCILDVLENNKRAIDFYEAHGFIDTNTEVKTVLGERNYTCKVLKKCLKEDVI